MVDGDVVELLRSVIRRANAVDLRKHEQSSADVLLARLVPRLLRLLQAMNGALRAIALEEVESGPEAVDVAFIARLELDGVRERLAALAGRDPDQMLGECSAAQRTLLRAGRAVLEELSGASRRARRPAELAVALRLRSAYARLRHELDLGEAPAPEQVREAVAALELRLRAFIAGDPFAEARIEDRLQLRGLAERMRAWLDAADGPAAGLRIWQDAMASAALIGRINLRGELVDHDRALLGEALKWLGRGELPHKLPERLRARLGRLYGRDDVVDALLDANAQLTESWREPLLRLGAELAPPVAQSA